MNAKRGFTLVELLFATGIVLPVLLSIIGLNVYVFGLTETARQSVIAVQDANTVIERARNISKNGLDAVVAAYPAGQTVSGFNSLPGEQVTVGYADVNADPLALTVTVNWESRGRTMTRILQTQVTKR